MKKTIALCLLFIISLFVITGCEGDSGLPSSKKSISLDFNKTIDYKVKKLFEKKRPKYIHILLPDNE